MNIEQRNKVREEPKRGEPMDNGAGYNRETEKHAYGANGEEYNHEENQEHKCKRTCERIIIIIMWLDLGKPFQIAHL